MTCENCGADHDNPMCECSVDGWRRGAELLEYVRRITEGEGPDEEDLRVMPLGEEGKEPAIEGTARLESNRADLMLMTVEEAYTALTHGHQGVVLYFGREDHGTENLLAVDRDHPEAFPDDEMPETGLKVVSGSGTDPGHYYYTHDGSVDNAAPEGVGEVRAENYYCVVPGSIHPSGGVYHLSENGTPGHITEDDIPESLEPSTNTYDRVEKGDVQLEPERVGEQSDYENEVGMSLSELRDRDEKLDSLLRILNPGGYPSRSEADMGTARKLWWWRFDKQQIADILRDYRLYEKTKRNDYIRRTLSKLDPDDRMDLDRDGSQPDPIGAVPTARLDAMDHHERRRYAKKRGIEWPDVDEVRDRLQDAIFQAISEGTIRVESSPTGSGKTYTVASQPWRGMPDVTGDQPVIHAHRTRDARDQARQMSDDADVDSRTLKGRKELCPVAAGAYDPDDDPDSIDITIEGVPISEWMDHRCDRQGIPFSVVHGWAESETDGDLPCQQGDTECAAKGQFEGIPRDDNGDTGHDVIHCTHQFLLVPSLRLQTNIAIDEKPAFGIDLTPQEVRESVNAYLDYIDAPVSSYNDLTFAAKEGRPPDVHPGETINGVTYGEWKEGFAEEMDEALNGENETVECPKCEGEGEFERPQETLTDSSNICKKCGGRGIIVEKRGKPPLSWYRDNHKAHALAPAFARAIWNAEQHADGRYAARTPYHPPRFDANAHDSAGWNRVYVDLVMDEQMEVIEAEAIPDFSLTRSVIGLDAHPQPQDPFWQANVHPDMETEYTLDTQERALYRRYERGLFTVQVGDGVQPVTSGEWLDKGQGDKFSAIIKQIRREWGDEFDSAITSLNAEGYIRDAMTDAGVEDPELMHYGEEESRNDFAGKQIGGVFGSIDPGDEMVMNMIARLGLDAEPVYKECPVCDGTGDAETDDGELEPCETCGSEGEVRERGRAFEGQDAETAEAVLKGVREHHVAQSAGRWARDAEDEDDNAIVFIATEAAPTGFIDAKVPGVVWSTDEDQRERLEYVRDQPEGATAREVADACGCSKRAAQRTLKKAREEGILEYNPGAGPHGAHIYWPGDEFIPEGSVSVADAENGPSVAASAGTATGGVKDNYTYTVSISARPDCAYNISRDEAGEWEYQSALGWFEEVPAPPG